jgi:hypothetical protein
MRGRFGAGEAILCFVLAAALDVTAGLRNYPGVLHGDLLNPDTFMRLVRLENMLDQHQLLHAVLRDGSGNGTVLHWSHMFDLLLVTLATPFRWFLPVHESLHAAALLIGPLAVGATGIAAAWAMAPLGLPSMRWTAAALVGLAPPVIAYGFPGVAHHHVLLGAAALVLAGSAGRLAAGDTRSGWILGLAAGLSVWLTPEAIPFILLAFGAPLLAWAQARKPQPIADGAERAGIVFFAVTALACAADLPAGGYLAVDLDRISAAYVLFAGMVWAVGACLALLPEFRLRGLTAAFAGVAGWIAVFPAVLQGTDGASPDARLMFAGIEEMQPVSTVPQALVFLFDGLLALGLCAWLARRQRSWLWAYGVLGVGATLLLGLMHLRFATYATLAGAAALPVILSSITTALADRPVLLPLARVGTVLVAMLATRADAIAGMFGAVPPFEPAMASSCPLRDIAPLFAGHDGAIVLSDVNDTPELLYRAKVETVGSLYHRNVPAFLRLRDAWRAVPGDVPGPEFVATGATLVLICPHTARSAMVKGATADTLYDRLSNGNPPAWLHQIGADAASGYVLYAVTP